MYIYLYIFFSFLNFNPKNIPGKDVEAGSPSKDICYQGQWAGLQPGYLSPLLPAYSRMGETVEVGDSWEQGPGQWWLWGKKLG